MRLLPARLPESPGGDDGAAVPPDHGQLIGRSFYIYTRVRTAVVLAIVTAAVFGRHVLEMNAIDVRQLTILAAFITLYNVVAWFFFRRFRDPEAPAESLTVLLFLTYAAVVLDFIALTVAIWCVGGARSPFTSFYVLHVMVSCTLLPRRAALALTALAYALLVGLVAVEWTGLDTPTIPVGAVAGDGPLDARYAFTILVVNGSLFAMSAFLLLAITRSLQNLEQRMRLANGELVRLSQQRKDFLNIAAHNLTAPIGAVTMLLDNMRGGLAGATTEKQRDWLDRSLKTPRGPLRLHEGHPDARVARDRHHPDAVFPRRPRRGGRPSRRTSTRTSPRSAGTRSSWRSPRESHPWSATIGSSRKRSSTT
ncbi:MAG: hypothetical protein IPF66_06790 [Holophagales bacterium]|nr:hypothetical protein [Holophagales bacterium]